MNEENKEDKSAELKNEEKIVIEITNNGENDASNNDTTNKETKTEQLVVFANLQKINEKFEDQDFMQRNTVLLTVLTEIYRLLSSSLLILFVPQNCNGHVCSLEENMKGDNSFYYVALSFNFLTLLSFLGVYSIEVIRENRLIKYLDVNTKMPNDSDGVEKRLELLPNDKKNKIISIDQKYQISGYVSIFIFIVNVIFSSIVVNEYYLSNQTTTTMITNVLLMLSKIISIYSVANTKKNVFYSAYLKTNVQYNDVDENFTTK